MPGSHARPVVIVEDDASVGLALERILRLGGMRSVTYDSAEALLKAGGVADATCLVFDVQLPGIDGFTLYERLASTGAIPPVIFITAFDEPEARLRATRANAFAFLTKPFAGRALLETIHRATQPGATTMT